MSQKSHHQRQEKLHIINRLSRLMSEENMEEISVPELQQQEDIQYLQNILQLQVCFNCLDEVENY